MSEALAVSRVSTKTGDSTELSLSNQNLVNGKYDTVFTKQNLI